MIVGGVKIDEFDDSVGISPGKPGQFIAGEGVPREKDALKFQGVEELPNILHQRSDVVAALWHFGFAVAAPGEYEHTKLVGEPGGEAVKIMSRSVHAVQKQKSPSCAAPIQIMEFHVVDGDESAFVGRLVCGIGSSMDLKHEHQRCPEQAKFQRLHTRLRVYNGFDVRSRQVNPIKYR